MKNNQNKMFISRRKAILGLLAAGAGVTASFATTPASFAATLSAFAKNPTPKKLKAGIKTRKIAFKQQKVAGKQAKATLKTYTPKTNKIASTLAATDTKATFTKYPVTSTSSPLPTAITTGDSGSDFWFTERAANRISKITTQGAITEYLLPLSGGEPDGGIANGPGDTFWFPYNSGNTGFIGRMVGASGQLTLYQLPTDTGRAIGITRGPNDTLWFTSENGKISSMNASGALTIFSSPSNIHETDFIAAGPDGALWFTYTGTSGNSGGVGRITTSGVYTLYPISDAFISDIATGRNNDLWFTGIQAGHGLIGNITTSGQLTLYIPSDSAVQTDQITHLGNGTFAFGAETSRRGEGLITYIGTITPAGDMQLFQTPELAAAEDMVYAGWANEVWFTSNHAIYKFRVTS